MTRKQFQKEIEKVATKAFGWHMIEQVVESATIIGDKEQVSHFAIVSVMWNGEYVRTLFYHYSTMKSKEVDFVGRYSNIYEAYDELGRRAAA